jgi:hypothetical protein
MAKQPAAGGSREPISIESEHDLRRHMRAICRRFNDDPALSRLLLVNPILAFADVGVTLSPAMREHVMNALRFPPKLRERIARLEGELKQELAALGVPADLPLDAARRADLAFRVLAVGAKAEHAGSAAATALTPSDLRRYAADHPLLAKLAEYERARSGAGLFMPTAVYQAYKEGRRDHRWIKAVRFKV